jgi:hypothetical protein
MSDFDSFANQDRAADAWLQQLLHARLLGELNSPIAQTQAIYKATIAKWQLPKIEPVATTAKNEQGYLNDVFLNFQPPVVLNQYPDTILAFSFGNRPGATVGAMPIPGPINQEIAKAVHRLSTRWNVKYPTIYAQWEIAEVLQSKYQIPAASLISVSPPTVSATGVVSEPSLAAVVAAVTALSPAAKLGTVAVVTHRDQLKSAIENALAAGLTAGAFDPESLPVDYDASATAPLNRQRYLFLLNDMFNQLGLLRANLIAAEYPNG